jgi:hypothetical protein
MFEINETVDTVDRLADKFGEMCDGVVKLKAQLIDAMINYSVSLMHNEDLKAQVASMKS